MSGWFSSWAREVVSSPIVETRRKCASSWRLRCASASARRRSVTSVSGHDGPSLGGAQRYHRHQVPAVRGAGHGYSRTKPFREPVEHALDSGDRVSRFARAPRGHAAPDLQVVRPTPPGRRPPARSLGGEPGPALVDDDDAPLPVEHRDVAGEGGKHRGLHRLAAAQGVLGLLARERAREHVGNEPPAVERPPPATPGPWRWRSTAPPSTTPPPTRAGSAWSGDRKPGSAPSRARPRREAPPGCRRRPSALRAGGPPPRGCRAWRVRAGRRPAEAGQRVDDRQLLLVPREPPQFDPIDAQDSPRWRSHFANASSIWSLGRCTKAAESRDRSSSKRRRPSSASAACLRSSRRALSSRRGMPVTVTNTWRATTLSSALSIVKGRCPDRAAPMATSAVARSDRLAPPGPNRRRPR